MINASLLIPCYNASKYITNFIANINELGFEEIIFYNDGSTDNTLILLKESGHQYLTSDINRGPGYARNQLLQRSKCKYVHFHDIDDPLSPSYLTEIKKLINNNYDAVFCDADWVDPETDQIIIKWQYKNTLFKQSGASYLLRNPIGGINGFYKKEALTAINGFDETLKVWEDSDLNIRLALNKMNIFFTESVLVKSLRHQKSASANSVNIRKYKYMFLKKHILTNDTAFRQEIDRQLNNLFHETIYQKDWSLYPSILQLAKKNNIEIPLSNHFYQKVLKFLIGPKLFTLLKYFFLQNFVFKKPAH